VDELKLFRCLHEPFGSVGNCSSSHLKTGLVDRPPAGICQHTMRCQPLLSAVDDLRKLARQLRYVTPAEPWPNPHEGPLGTLRTFTDHFVLRCPEPGARSFAPPGAV
jgi:hypothetical protein